MHEAMTPHRGVSIVIKGPGRGFRLGMSAFALALVAAAMFVGRGTGYAYGPPSLRSGLAAPDLPVDPGATRKLQTKLAAQNKTVAMQARTALIL